MTITIRKATEADIDKLKNNPTWGCEVSEFDWVLRQRRNLLAHRGRSHRNL